MAERGLYVVAAQQTLSLLLHTATELGLDATDTVTLLRYWVAALRVNRRKDLVADDPLGYALTQAIDRLYKSKGGDDGSADAPGPA